jgi:hypothetical protein
VVAGRIDCVGLHIKPYEVVESLNSAVLRSIPLARLAQQDARARLERAQALLADAQLTGDPQTERRARYLETNLPQAGRPGRKPDPDEHYRDIAAKYMQALKDGIRSPTKHLAAQEHVDYSTAATWVRRARERGYIPATTRGKITWPDGEGK